MSTTHYLLLAILGLLLLKFYPGPVATVASVALVVAGLYGCYWLVARFPAWRRKRKLETLQAEKDEREFWEWHKRHDAIRLKFDPQGKWNEATSVPREYLTEIRSLNSEYREVLQRRNGWSANDFIDSDALYLPTDPPKK